MKRNLTILFWIPATVVLIPLMLTWCLLAFIWSCTATMVDAYYIRYNAELLKRKWGRDAKVPHPKG